MERSVKHWLVVGLFLGTTIYALAEDITLTTYYPSPRGVYQELRTAGNVQIGTIDPPAGTVPRLHVVQDQAAPAFRVDDEDAPGDTTPFVISDTGNVGIGIEAPTETLHVIGDARIEGTVSAQAFGSLSPLIFKVQGTERMRITDTGDIGIGTDTPDGKALVDFTSDSNPGKGVAMPRMEASHRPDPNGAGGLMVYNEDAGKVEYSNGTDWISFSGSGVTVNNLTGSRAIDTTYQNTSGKNRMVAVTVGANAGWCNLNIGPIAPTINVAQWATGTGIIAVGTISAWVPDTWHYRVMNIANCSLYAFGNNWIEYEN